MTEPYLFLLGLLLLHSVAVTRSLDDNEVPIVSEPTDPTVVPKLVDDAESVHPKETTKEIAQENAVDEAKVGVEAADPAITGDTVKDSANAGVEPAGEVDSVKDEKDPASAVDPAKAVEPDNALVNPDTKLDPVVAVSSNKSAASNESPGANLDGKPEEASTTEVDSAAATDPAVPDNKLLPEDKPPEVHEPDKPDSTEDKIPQNPKFHTNKTASDPIPSKNENDTVARTDSEDDVTPAVSPKKEVETSNDFRLSFAPKLGLPDQTKSVSFLQLFLVFAVLSVFAYVGYSYRHRLKLYFFNNGSDIHYHPLRTMQHNAVD